MVWTKIASPRRHPASIPKHTSSAAAPTTTTHSNPSQNAQGNQNQQTQKWNDWQNAINRFKNDTGVDFAKEKLTPFFNDFMRDISLQHEQFVRTTQKWKTLRTWLSTAIRPIEQLGPIVAKAASTTFPPAEVIFLAVEHLFDAAREVDAYYTAIAEVLKKLSYFSNRLNTYIDCDCLSLALRVIIGDALIHYLDVIRLSIKRMKGWRISLWGKFTLLGNDTEMSDIINRLEELMVLEANQRSTEMLKIEKEISKNIKRLADAQIDALLERRGRGHYLLEPNSPPFPSADRFNTAKDDVNQFIPDCGQWLHQENAYLRWFSRVSGTAFVWIQAPSGMGRRYVAVSVVDDIASTFSQELQQSQNAVSVAYYLCASDDISSQSVDMALRSLAFQINRTDAQYCEYLDSMTRGPLYFNNIFDAWNKLFEGYFCKETCTSSAYLVLYGLEWADTRELDQLLRAISGSNALCGIKKRCGISICIISDPQLGSIMEKLKRPPSSIVITGEKTKADLKSYVKAKLSRMEEEFADEPNMQAEIERKLMNESTGSFLWVDFMLSQLEGAYGMTSVFQAILKGTPTNLGNTTMVSRHMDGLVKSLSTPGTIDLRLSHLRHILHWVIVVPRPLSIRALEDTFHILPNGARLIKLPQYIRFLYGGLFELTTRRGGMLDLSDEIIQLRKDNATELRFENDSPARQNLAVLSGSRSKITPDEKNIFVRIRHPFLRDYIVGEASRLCPSLFINEAEATISTLVSSLEVFTQNDKYEICKDGLASTAARFHEYLQRDSVLNATAQNKVSVAMAFMALIDNDDAVKRWTQHAIFFLRSEILSSDEFWGAVKKLFSTPEVSTAMSSINSFSNLTEYITSGQKELILEKVAQECGARWMEGDDRNFEYEVLFIHSYLEKVGPNSSLPGTKRRLQDFSTDSIMKLADHFDRLGYMKWTRESAPSVEGQNSKGIAHCLSRLSTTLVSIGDIDKAIELGKRSIELDAENANTYTALAESYFRKGDLDEASRNLQRCLELAGWVDLRARMIAQDKLLCIEEGNKGSDSKYEAALELMRSEMGAANVKSKSWLQEHDQYLCLCHGQHHRVTEMIQDVLTSDLSKGSPNQWIRYFTALLHHWGHHQLLASYALRTGNWRLVSDLYTFGVNVLAMAHTEGARPLFQFYESRMNLRLNRHREIAQASLDEAVTTMMTTPISPVLRTLALIEKETMYLVQGLRKISANDPEKEFFLNHFTELGNEISASSEITDRPDALVLAVWKRHNGDVDTSRGLVRPFIHHALKLIEGPDLLDWYGWYLLSYSLMAAGDRTAALYAFRYIKEQAYTKLASTVMPYADAEERRPPEDPEHWFRNHASTSKNIEVIGNEYQLRPTIKWGTYSGFLCDSCGRLLLAEEFHWHCTSCITTDFCRHCYRVLKLKLHILVICDPSHEFLLVPPDSVALKWHVPFKVRESGRLSAPPRFIHGSGENTHLIDDWELIKVYDDDLIQKHARDKAKEMKRETWNSRLEHARKQKGGEWGRRQHSTWLAELKRAWQV